MTDASVEQEPDQSRFQPTHSDPDLRYPQILLQASFVSLLSNSIPSNASSQITVMPPSDISERGLGESWATLSNSDFTSDDEVQSQHTEATDSASLVPTDVSEDGQDRGDHVAIEECIPPSPSLELVDAQMEDSAVTSTETVLAPQELPQLEVSCVRDAPAEDVIEFPEPEQWPEAGQVDLKHTVKVFSEVEKDLLPFMPPTSSTTQVIGTLRMTMSKASLRRDQPFRLLYCGHPDASQARKDILEKFGDILVANADHSAGHVESSRYQVIPTVFGPGSSPQSDLMQLRFQQMIVDECVDARRMVGFDDVYRKADTTLAPIQLRYKNGDEVRSEWDPHKYMFRTPRIRGELWDPPDVAVMILRKDDNAGALRCRQYVQEFMSRHAIPTLVIREDGDWSTPFETVSFDQQSLHMCVESRPVTSFDPGRVFKRLPIDLTTFCNLDTEQLHKHLACLIDICSSRDLTISTQPWHYSSMSGISTPPEAVDLPGKVENRFADQMKAFSDMLHRNGISRQTQTRAVYGVLAFVAFSMLLHVTSFAVNHLRPSRFFWSLTPLTTHITQNATAYLPSSSSVDAHTVTQISSASSASAKVQALSSVSAILAASASLASMTPPGGLPGRQHDPSKSLAVISGNTDLARLFTTAGLETVNKSEQFLVEVIGDCHVIIKVPQKILPKRKPPTLTVRVLRGDVELKSNLSRLFDGVYAVQIEHDEAHGPLNVTISSSKSAVEIYQVDFGSPWWVRMRGVLRAPLRNEAAIRSRIDSARALVLDEVPEILMRSLQSVRHQLASLQVSFTNSTTQVRSRTEYLREYQKQAVKQFSGKTGLVKQDVKRIIAGLGAKAQVEGSRVVGSAANLTAGLQKQLHILRDKITQLDVRQWKTQAHDRTRSESLATAQERAKQIVRDAVKSAKDFRRSSARKVHTHKHKRGNKVRWHDNVRVRW